MDKTRAMPILASAVMALSLTACQGMMGGKDSQQSSSAQTSSGQTASQSSRASASAEQQAVAPDMVRDIQRTLGAKGYDAGQPDGVYGASTEQALRRFQRDQRLNATGQLDTQTLAALGLTGDAQAGQRAATGGAAGSRSYTPSTQRQGAMATQSQSRLSSDQVRNVQQNLADRGYDAGQPDGLWGPRTQQALRNFERDQDLQADGRPDPQSLAALGVETGSPATQTGQMPSERRSPPPSQQRGSVDLEQRDVEDPGQQQGLLPPTGSQAPGSARESERETVNPGQAPATRPQPEE
ncbi:MAG: peptidoglycan-binding protein [Rhodospirillaceae bacterium]|nr:peptidoglycan-binding protein [Rhodospirillales bacterium]